VKQALEPRTFSMSLSVTKLVYMPRGREHELVNFGSRSLRKARHPRNGRSSVTSKKSLFSEDLVLRSATQFYACQKL